MDWIVYSLIAMVALGVSMSLYKMPSFKGYSSFHSTFWTNIFTLLTVVVVYFFFLSWTTMRVISWYGLLWGVLFALTMAQQKILLKRMETNTLLPVTSSLGNVITVAIGIMFFSETLSPLRWLAAAFILSSVFLYSRKKGGLILDSNSILLGLGIITVSTLSKVVQKVGAVHDTILHFSLYQYIGASASAVVLIYFFERSTFPQLFSIRRTWKISFINGAFMAITGFAFLKALAIGPLSGVYPIAAGYIFVTAILGAWLYKEKLTRYKIGLLALTFIGIVLMKLG